MTHRIYAEDSAEDVFSDRLMIITNQHPRLRSIHQLTRINHLDVAGWRWDGYVVRVRHGLFGASKTRLSVHTDRVSNSKTKNSELMPSSRPHSVDATIALCIWMHTSRGNCTCVSNTVGRESKGMLSKTSPLCRLHSRSKRQRRVVGQKRLADSAGIHLCWYCARSMVGRCAY